MLARCACGSVEVEASGSPITSAVCYCDTCQDAARRLEALPGGTPVAEDGGTAYVLYRTDRFRYTRGAERVRDLEPAAATATRRVVAGCCNAPMLMRFEDARHWVALYRARLAGDVVPLQYRICTKFRPGSAPLPDDVPSAAEYPFGFVMKLLGSKIAMLLRR